MLERNILCEVWHTFCRSARNHPRRASWSFFCATPLWVPGWSCAIRICKNLVPRLGPSVVKGDYRDTGSTYPAACLQWTEGGWRGPGDWGMRYLRIPVNNTFFCTGFHPRREVCCGPVWSFGCHAKPWNSTFWLIFWRRCRLTNRYSGHLSFTRVSFKPGRMFKRLVSARSSGIPVLDPTVGGVWG